MGRLYNTYFLSKGETKVPPCLFVHSPWEGCMYTEAEVPGDDRAHRCKPPLSKTGKGFREAGKINLL